MVQKSLIIIGLLFIVFEFWYPFFRDIGFGRLSGDIVIKKKTLLFIFQK